MFGQLSFNVPFVIGQHKGQIDSITIYLPQYNSQNCPVYDNEFDQPQFNQREVNQLKITIDGDVEPREQQIDWQIAVMKHFQFRKIIMKASYFNKHLFLLSEYQQNIEEFEVNLKDCYDHSHASEFFLNQNKFQKMRILDMQSLQSLIHPQLEIAFTQFLLANLDNLEILRLTLESNSMLQIFSKLNPYLTHLTQSDQQQQQNQLGQLASSTKLQEIHLSFANIKKLEYGQFEKINLEENLYPFISAFKNIKVLKLYFPFVDYRCSKLDILHKTIGSQNITQSIESLLLCITRSRIAFDLLNLFQEIEKLRNLKRLELNLSFCTRISFSTPTKVIELPSVQTLKLNLTYQQCSSLIFQYTHFTNLIRLKVILNYISNRDVLRQNVFNLIEMINQNQHLNKLSINISQSAPIDRNIKELLLNAIQNKTHQINNLKLFMPDQQIIDTYQFKNIFNIEKLILNLSNFPIIEIRKDQLIIGSIWQKNKSIDNSSLKQFLDFCENRLNEKIHHISLYSINTLLNDSSLLEYKTLMNTLHSANYLTNISIYFQNQPIFIEQMTESVINILQDFPYLLRFEIISQTFYQMNLSIKKEDALRILELLSKRYQIRRFNYFHVNSQNFSSILLNRYKEFYRLLKSIKKLLVMSSIQQNFRRDILYQILEYTFYNPQNNSTKQNLSLLQ